MCLLSLTVAALRSSTPKLGLKKPSIADVGPDKDRGDG